MHKISNNYNFKPINFPDLKYWNCEKKGICNIFEFKFLIDRFCNCNYQNIDKKANNVSNIKNAALHRRFVDYDCE